MAAVRVLFNEYQRAIGVDLCFQGFDQELTALPGAYASPRGRLYLARRDETPCGCVGLRPLDARCGEVKRLYLRPGLRGLGLGRILMRRLIGDARQIGYTRLVLDTLPSMSAARALYRAVGFVQTDAYYENPLPEVEYYALELG